MADWTTIPDSSIEPGKPIRSIDGLALRDNPIAIAEGATGAPRIFGEGIAQYNELPVLTVTAANTFQADDGNKLTLGTLSTNSTSDVVAATYVIGGYTGSIRFNASHYTNSSPYYSNLSIYKNGSLVASWSTYASETPIQRSVDISVMPNDIIEWRHRSQGVASSLVQLVRSYASNAWYATTAFRRYA